MNKFTLLPTLATGAALIFGASSASAGGNPPIVNCVNNACFTLQPGAVDSDNDGFTDDDEKAYGSDPFDASSRPTMPWLIESLGNGTLPSYWLVPQIDLITVTPDGHAITAGLQGLMDATGMTFPTIPERTGMPSFPGIDLGTIGGTLNWDIHANDIPANPAPPNAPNKGLVSSVAGPHSSVHVAMEKGDVYISNSMLNGDFTSLVQVYDRSGKLLGEGTSTSTNPNTAQDNAVSSALKGATPEATTDITNAVAAETAKNAADDQAANDKAAKEKADKDKAAKDKADKEKADADAKKKKDGGEQSDPDADQGVDPSTLTSDQVGDLVRASNGSDHTNTGNPDNTPRVEVTTTEYVPPTFEVIHVDPDANQGAGGTPNGTTPHQGGSAGPDVDPHLPGGPAGALSGPR